MSLKHTIEALLFATDQPLTLGRFQEVLPEVERSTIQAALQELEQEYDADQRAFRVQRVAGGWQLATRPEYAEVVRRLFVGKRRVRLTKPALEALAIIAYKQPTTRPEVDAIRGVSSGGVLETLLERSLVGIAGRADGVGRPLLYATTPEFLQYLGLNDMKDLPSLAELEGMLAEREAEMRRQEEDEMRELAAAGAPADAAARLEEPPRELASLEELDAELQERGAAIRDVAARVAAFDAESEPEAGEPPASPAVTDEARDERADPPAGNP
jgi:segregation and condensation protein B